MIPFTFVNCNLRDILIIVVISYPAAEYRKIYRKYGNIFRLEFIPLYAPFLCGGTLAQHKEKTVQNIKP